MSKQKRININVDEETHWDFKNYCFRKRKTISQILRRFIKAKVKKLREGENV